MNLVLGSFIERWRFPNPTDFYQSVWTRALAGPNVIRPRRCGSFEPLKPVSRVDIQSLLQSDFYCSAGSRCSLMVNAPAFQTHKFFTVTIHLNFRASERDVADGVYEWLVAALPYRYVYLVTRTRELLEHHREFHQAINAGLVEVNLPIALRHPELFDRFTQAGA